MGTLRHLITDFLSLLLFNHQIVTFELSSGTLNLWSPGLNDTIISALFANSAIIHLKVHNLKYLFFLESFAWRQQIPDLSFAFQAGRLSPSRHQGAGCNDTSVNFKFSYPSSELSSSAMELEQLCSPVTRGFFEFPKYVNFAFEKRLSSLSNMLE